MSRIDLDQLEAVVKKATPGPWFVDEFDQVVAPNYERVGEDDDGDLVISEANDEKHLAYVAALSPDTALALIEVARAATKALEGLRKLELAGAPMVDDRCFYCKGTWRKDKPHYVAHASKCPWGVVHRTNRNDPLAAALAPFEGGGE